MLDVIKGDDGSFRFDMDRTTVAEFKTTDDLARHFAILWESQLAAHEEIMDLCHKEEIDNASDRLYRSVAAVSVHQLRKERDKLKAKLG